MVSADNHSKIHHPHIARSMRTIRSNFFQVDHHSSNTYAPSSSSSDAAAAASPPTLPLISENLTESYVELNLRELASRNNKSVKSSLTEDDLHELSRSFSDFSACSSDISGELQRLASVPPSEIVQNSCNADVDIGQRPESDTCLGYLLRENFSTENIESISLEDLLPTVKICIDGLMSPSIAVQRSAAAKIRLMAKNCADNRILIGESGAIPALVPLLRCSDPLTQEQAVTALLNLSIHEDNKILITNAGAVKSLIFALKTGTEISKQNAACALLSLALVEENKSSIGACGAIPPLVKLLLSGSNRGKKDALTTLYKLCSVRQNKERAVSTGAVRPLVELVAEQEIGMVEKAMVVLSSLAQIQEGKDAIVEEGGIGVLVEAIEDGSLKGKEFAVLTLVQLCADSVRNRGLLVREGAIPPLVALTQIASVRTKHNAETLLGYLRESRHDASA